MPYLIHPIAVRAPFVRSVAIAALLGTTMLATPLAAAWAQNAPVKTAATPDATQTKGETVEQRITALHTAMKITPDEETQWNGVARAMRENAAAMDKLLAATRTTPPQSMSAVDDLKTYEKFAQAHVDGLKNLTSAFTSLYGTMPDAQKKVADKVFDTSERGADTTPPGKQG